jgi:hypothetical protein
MDRVHLAGRWLLSGQGSDFNRGMSIELSRVAGTYFVEGHLLFDRCISYICQKVLKNLCVRGECDTTVRKKFMARGAHLH